MKLEAVTAELRPRSDWEAVDLGLALVRRDFWTLSGAWWLGMLPLLLLAPLGVGHPFGYLFLFWWWTPVASRLALFRLSRVLFGEAVGWRDLCRELPRAMWRRCGYRLLWARLSPWRPLTMPVEDLEGLRGTAYRGRCRALMRRGDSTVIMLALWRLFLNLWLILILCATGLLFLPQALRNEWIELMQISFDGGEVELPRSMSVALMLACGLSCWLVDLFITGCGFGIYVNHRTWVEGWDVELAFRRLGRRLGAAMVVVFGIGLLSGIDPAVAEPPKEVISEILKDPDFEVHTETSKRLTDLGWDPGGLGAGLVAVLKVMFWVVVIALLVWLLYLSRHWFLNRFRRRLQEKKPAPPRVIMGMEVTPESLPSDVPRVALEAWHAGQRHEAMSLLYRGSIAWMIRHGGVAIAESDTESDCLSRVRREGVANEAYFGRVTELWMRLAYARTEPEFDQVEKLCSAWPFAERRVL